MTNLSPRPKNAVITPPNDRPGKRPVCQGLHKRQFAYEAHTVCDKNGLVLETVVTPGNVHDSVAFDEVYDRVVKKFSEVETIELVFADAKEKHAMRYTQYRGLAQVTKWVKLKFVVMNLKKLARWLWKGKRFLPAFLFSGLCMPKTRPMLET